MIEFEGREYSLAADETVLDCLLRHGVRVSSFCRSGACQSCVLKVTSGEVPAVARAGLKPAHQQQGFFLSCRCRPTGPLRIERCDDAPTFESTVTRVARLSAQVLGVWLTRPAGFEFRAGQFVQLVRPDDGLMRPYSLASLPNEDQLELHVAVRPGGRMSGWLEQAAHSPVQVRGPFGECFYQEGELDRPLILAGTGTGLAPLSGILKAAARAEHRATVTLFHGSSQPSGIYLREAIEPLCEALPGLQLVASVPEAAPNEIGIKGRWQFVATPLDQLLLARHPKLASERLYFCGNPSLVQRLRLKAYLGGAPLDRIHGDAFATP